MIEVNEDILLTEIEVRELLKGPFEESKYKNFNRRKRYLK